MDEFTCQKCKALLAIFSEEYRVKCTCGMEYEIDRTKSPPKVKSFQLIDDAKSRTDLSTSEADLITQDIEDSVEATPFLAAGMLMMWMIDKKPPFDRFDCLDVAVDEAYQSISTFGYAYKIATYLLMLQQYFGSELSEIVAAYMRVQADRAKYTKDEKFANPFLSDIVDLAYRMKQFAVRAFERRRSGEDLKYEDIAIKGEDIPLEYGLALFFLSQFPESPLVQQHGGNKLEVEDIPGELDISLADILIKAKNAAVQVFEPIVQTWEFRQESIEGLILKPEV
jgi:hypothetical protein